MEKLSLFVLAAAAALGVSAANVQADQWSTTDGTTYSDGVWTVKLDNQSRFNGIAAYDDGAGNAGPWTLDLSKPFVNASGKEVKIKSIYKALNGLSTTDAVKLEEVKLPTYPEFTAITTSFTDFSALKRFVPMFPAGVSVTGAMPPSLEGEVTISVASGAGVGNQTFKGCTKITSVNLTCTSANLAGDGSSGRGTFAGCTGLKTVVIDNPNLTTLPNIFNGCTALETVTLNATALTTINGNAFVSCSSLTDVSASVWAPTVQTIGGSAFSGCSALFSGAALNLPAVTSIAADAFKGVPLVDVTIGDGTADVAILDGNTSGSGSTGAFLNCTSLKRAVVNAKSLSLGTRAFRACSVLTNVTVKAETLAVLGGFVFQNDTKLESVDWECPAPETQTYPTGTSIFNGANSKLVNRVPMSEGWETLDGVTGLALNQTGTWKQGGDTKGVAIEYGKIETVTHKVDLTLAGDLEGTDSLDVVDGGTFTYNFKSKIPFGKRLVSAVSTAGQVAGTVLTLENVTADTAITLTVTLAVIPTDADWTLTASEDGKTTFIEDGYWRLPVTVNGTELTMVMVTDATSLYPSEPAALDLSKKVVGENGETFTIVEFQTAWANWQFGWTGRAKIGSLKLPTTLTTIGGNAFRALSAVSGDLVIPDSVTSISGYSFYQATFDGQLVIGSGVTEIPVNAFIGASKFTSVIQRGNALTTIGDSAFNGLSACTSVSIESTELTSIGAQAFYGMAANAVIDIASPKLSSWGTKMFSGGSSFLVNLACPPFPAPEGFTGSGFTTVRFKVLPGKGWETAVGLAEGTTFDNAANDGKGTMILKLGVWQQDGKWLQADGETPSSDTTATVYFSYLLPKAVFTVLDATAGTEIGRIEAVEMPPSGDFTQDLTSFIPAGMTLDPQDPGTVRAGEATVGTLAFAEGQLTMTIPAATIAGWSGTVPVTVALKTVVMGDRTVTVKIRDTDGNEIGSYAQTVPWGGDFAWNFYGTVDATGKYFTTATCAEEETTVDSTGRIERSGVTADTELVVTVNAATRPTATNYWLVDPDKYTMTDGVLTYNIKFQKNSDNRKVEVYNVLDYKGGDGDRIAVDFSKPVKDVSENACTIVRISYYANGWQENGGLGTGVINGGTLTYADLLRKLILPQTGLETLAQHSNAKNLETIEPFLPKGVMVEQMAFLGCAKLSGHLVYNGPETIGARAFESCASLQEVTLGKTVTSTPDGAVQYALFANCSSLTNATLLSRKMTKIGALTFTSCGALEKVTVMAKALETLGGGAFGYCKNLKEIFWHGAPPQAVGSELFFGCGVEQVTVFVDKAKGWGIWDGCTWDDEGRGKTGIWTLGGTSGTNPRQKLEHRSFTPGFMLLITGAPGGSPTFTVSAVAVDAANPSVALGSDGKTVAKGGTYTWDFSGLIPSGKKIASWELETVGGDGNGSGS